MTEKLEPGWYWVKLWQESPWEIVRRRRDEWWLDNQFVVEPAVIGPRLTPPTEKE